MDTTFIEYIHDWLYTQTNRFDLQHECAGRLATTITHNQLLLQMKFELQTEYLTLCGVHVRPI